ncbi:SMC N-terminal domain-containing protein [Ordospora colligata]|uniref:Structural maintenance of chromosomes protein 5 n=1 Tax=Ordospora colligata OC4 TaxID=1354746 RepID=A0A0B2UI95_9MICR|nr:SMC N-terminal domain-containing protein [Ordospora colligata OC4]KHN68964.1 SMC N-terminal domain-containing protein [Ordospora colligata OC4]TBU14187.1 SMC N-terminal domain-containing protein [Ordospora colligata]TBU17856.1 SMC N-terminal domain-containing protein [Ordospora colligata]
MVGFSDGSIMSLRLENFQTFKKTVLTFCASFNFIVGANGSGKSSIANAIVLLFGGTPRCIGRGKTIGEYVRYGEEAGKIEACVHYEGKELLLGRYIRKDGQSKYFVDGVACKKTEYEDVIRRLRGNVGNLCQFLPQEKVAEFTRLSCEELLIEVLEAVEEEEALRMIKELGELECEKKKVIEDLEVECKRKECVDRMVKSLGSDVRKMKEKEEKENRIKMMREKKDWMIYAKYLERYLESKRVLSILKRQMEEKASDASKIVNEIEELKCEESQSRIDLLIHMLYEDDEVLSKLIIDLKRIQHDFEMLEVDKECLKNKEDRREAEISNAKQEIEELEEEMCKIKVPTCPKEINTSIVYDLEEKASNLMRKRGKIQHESGELKRSIDDLNGKKRGYEQMEEMRMQILKKYHIDTYRAVCWLRENRHKFKGEIIEPPFLHLRIKDADYTIEVENFLGFQSLSPFICKQPEDFERFVEIMKDEKKWKINVIEAIRSDERSGDAIVNKDVLMKLGFDGVLSDFLECRDEVLDYLNVVGHFDQIPVCKKCIDETVVFKTTNVRRMAAGGRYIEVKRSRYGEDYVIIDNPLKARNLFSAGLSFQELKEVENELESKNAKRRQNEEELKSVLKEHEMVDKQLQDAYEEKRRYDALHMEVKKKETQIKVLNGTIERKKQEMKTLETRSDLIKESHRIDVLAEELDEKQEYKCEEIKKHLYNEKYFEMFCEAQRVSIDVVRIRKKRTTLLECKQAIDKALMDIEIEALDKKKECRETKKLIEEKKSILSGINKTEEYELRLAELPNSIQELDEEISKEMVRLKFYNADEKAINELETSICDLEQINRKIQDNRDNLKSIEENVSKIKEQAIYKIDKLTHDIGKLFTDLFKMTGGDGKIKFVSDDLDVCKWKLNIMVKFNSEQNLEVLSSHRQSGGERSVSIILFLLAMQDHIASPFRLVDEINQGMDADNEKLIHDILVTLSEQQKIGQFFMITPKIVPGLTYCENMKVIVLYSFNGRVDQADFIKYKLKMLA